MTKESPKDLLEIHARKKLNLLSTTLSNESPRKIIAESFHLEISEKNLEWNSQQFLWISRDFSRLQGLL